MPVHRCIKSSNPKTNGYRNLKRAIWPIVEDPHARLEEEESA